MIQGREEGKLLVDNLRSVAYSIFEDSKHVVIQDHNLNSVAKIISDYGNDKSLEASRELGFVDRYNTVLMELIANSINYCYWYGYCRMRPGKSSSTTMYQILKEAMEESKTIDGHISTIVCKRFIDKLVINRFPLLSERRQHLMEIFSDTSGLRGFCESILNCTSCLDALSKIVFYAPGFASDIFLKRAQLFCMQIEKELHLFDDIEFLTVAADYKLPAILRQFGILKYEKMLAYRVDSEELLPKQSREEVEIRSATIVVCDKLAEMSGTSCMVVDDFLWDNKKFATKPFHLTVTTDY